MEKLFLSTVTILIFFLCGNSIAQENEYYCTFQVEGSPMLDDKIVLSKGMFIKPENFLALRGNDQLILVDQDGIMYEIDKQVIMPFERIKKYAKIKEQSYFTINYLKYVWKRLWEREEKKENIGVVFRAPKPNLAISPLDSALLKGPMIKFNWLKADKDSLSYLYLAQNKSEEITKIGLNGDKIFLPVQEGLLSPNKSYRWAVSIEADAKIENLQFQQFKILSDEEFEKRLDFYSEAIKEFQLLGLSPSQIKTTLCEDVNLCEDE